MLHYVLVILPLALEKLFAYRINSAEAAFIQPGMRVAVSFGKTKIYTAIVHSLVNDVETGYDIKDIEFIIDDAPVVTSTQLKFWEWIASYYVCSIGQVMKAAMPKSFLLESETIILKNDETRIDENQLTDQEYLVLEALDHRPALKIQDVIAIIDRKTVLPLLKKMLAQDYIILQEEVYHTYKPKTNKFIYLNEQYQTDTALKDLLEELSRSQKQRDVVMTLFMMRAGSNKEITSVELQKRASVTRAVIKALVEKSILIEIEKTVDRILEEREAGKQLHDLNDAQTTALTQIKTAFESNKTTLLHGVTSSGKTEVYVRLIKEQLTQGNQCLYLLPEIALTTQLIARLRNFFKNQVLVYHSKYNLNERLEIWNHVLEAREPYVIIGARSAMWLPFEKLGLVVVDEEHDTSYKQNDPAPRYHARDASIVLAHLLKAKVLLGSATPSIESFHNVQLGKYALVELKIRYGNVLMPDIQIVDIKDKVHRKKMQGDFSDTLIAHMQEAFNNGNQVILFQNRRGFAPVMECDTCGYAPQCPNCDVSLTYHKFKQQLRCHFCGFHQLIPKECAACTSTALDTKGLGTEQIEAQFKDLFPDRTITRMDLDTTRGKESFEKIIAQVENQSIDCLVGTQMVTKGLDFRNVSLVGVMRADSMLNFPDFRSHERCFQLLTQVAGRAGRTQERGKVLIQSYNPLHQILQQVSRHDYDTMYKEQVEDRYQFNYPPFKRLIRLTFKHKDYTTTLQAAQWFVDALNQIEHGTQVLGPEFPAIARIRNLYNVHVIVKIDRSQSTDVIKKYIRRVQRSFEAIKQYRAVRCNIDVDHY